MSKIARITAREILASNGMPTIEAEVELTSGVTGVAAVPWGASAGKYEATTLVDGDSDRYSGNGMLRAVKNVEEIIAAEVVGKEATDQRTVDAAMIALDGTENKARLGGNAILATSLAVARAGANEAGVPLWKYITTTYRLEKVRIPRPMVVMIEGGKHASQSVDLQEYLVTILEKKSIVENLEIEREIYEALKKILESNGLSTNVGNEGAFAPSGLSSNEQPIEYLVEAIKSAGYTPGKEVGISLDAAASEFFDETEQNYDLKVEGRKVSGVELIAYYREWLNKYPIITVEDMFAEDDWPNWINFYAQLQGVVNIGDDLTVTNAKRLQMALDRKTVSGIIIKLNQAGTLTETIDCCQLATKNGVMLIPSHRGGGETNDTAMVDVAVAVGAEYLKVGITRGERVVKYNRLMEIEEEINRGL